MNTSEIFQQLLSNLIIKNKDQISRKYKNITKALNKDFFDDESEIKNSLQVGSYGRKTAVNGISDLDMLFELTPELFTKYDNLQNNGQSTLLQDVKSAILNTYSTTDIRGDGQVVVVSFTNDIVEVCPVFEQSDGSYKYPDTNNGGKWKKTNPKPEISEINSFNITTNSNLKNLAKMTRAWKNKCGVKIGGLLIDTLCYEFLVANTNHHTTTFSDYDIFVRDFFEYLKNLDKNRDFWYAPGSNQKVYKKKSNFISKAKKAHKNVLEAIDKENNSTVYTIWKKVFGYPFPYPSIIKEQSIDYTENEEFIEDLFPVDIITSMRINCEVNQPGFRVEFLRNMYSKLKINKKLKFYIESNDVKKPYLVKWKVKNEGSIAKSRNNLRGHILNDKGSEFRKENSNFAGAHFVECYIIKDNICVARDRIDVPISNI
ncbi:hypothetical protein SAMN06265371_106185 [Lutibacter agarilyticus]|uniref:Adenylyl/Guanylyl and SMODS C-terminal sensor domain-containing protein n=1 Tax=Lutibacter agarilyticus TaxID=1109740 RepID=A0A238XMS2_9FLAO|nr:nucleotidyltransferase [Lutibacter agarilyticus]SNR60275.1 hypothetical protein SAMN06265371_106185 [Lutibacter agarilyticus]